MSTLTRWTHRLWSSRRDIPAVGRRLLAAWRPLVFGAALLTAVVLAHLLVFPPSPRVPELDLEVGTVNGQEILARIDFVGPVSPTEMLNQQTTASREVEPVFRRQYGVAAGLRRLEPLLDRVEALALQDTIPVEERVAVLAASERRVDRADLVALLDPERLPGLRTAVAAATETLLTRGLVRALPMGRYPSLRVLDAETGASALPAGSVVVESQRDELVRRVADQHLERGDDVDVVVGIVSQLVTPNLLLDEHETEQAKQRAIDAVQNTGVYTAGESILGKSTRVTPHLRNLLQAYKGALQRDAEAGNPTVRPLLYAGRVLLLILVLGLLVFLLRGAEPSAMSGWQRPMLLTILLVLFLAASALTSASFGQVAVPVPLIAMLATVLFGPGVGARVALASIGLLVLVPGHATEMVAVWIAVAGASVHAVRRVRKRSQFYRAMAEVSAVYLVGVVALYLPDLPDRDGLDTMIDQVLIAVGTGVASTAITLFLLPLLEALFGVTTDLTLLELSDLNHPLLKRMSLESPGTYHHSQVVGTLAEAGAQAIGANSLLARVGANFHDIGKMLKPRYFVENQLGDNAHDELTPSMSALVIAAHVRDGVELGRQWGLPSIVTDFIPEHHGTSVMHYFYQKALGTDDGETIKVDDFRYPGPKPRCRETAIVMLADGSEAATRSLQRPSHGRVREMVKKIFDRRIAEEQLDECGLTFADIARIREAFVPILVGIHHHRVPYPGQREHEEKKEQESLAARSRSKRGAPGVASRG